MGWILSRGNDEKILGQLKGHWISYAWKSDGWGRKKWIEGKGVTEREVLMTLRSQSTEDEETRCKERRVSSQVGCLDQGAWMCSRSG